MIRNPQYPSSESKNKTHDLVHIETKNKTHDPMHIESKNKTHDPVHRRFLNLTVGFQSEVDCVVSSATTLTTSPPPPELAGKVPMMNQFQTVVSFLVTTEKKFRVDLIDSNVRVKMVRDAGFVKC